LNGLWSAALVLFSSIDPGFKTYYISMGSDVELETLLLIASKMGFINVEDEMIILKGGSVFPGCSRE
jgi:hypothetical protein